MAVYVDPARWPWRGSLWCHLTADSLEELHTFAAAIGLRRSWFQDGPRPHYDMIAWRRARAVQHGAIEITSRELVLKVRALAQSP